MYKPESNKPFKPMEYTKAQSHVFKALSKGEATEQQQKDAVAFLINDLCKTYDSAFHPVEPRWQDFKLGMQHIGQQVRFLINSSMENFK